MEQVKQGNRKMVKFEVIVGEEPEQIPENWVEVEVIVGEEPE